MSFNPILLTAIVLLSAASINLLFFRPVFIAVFFERVFIELALRDPETLSRLHLIESFGLKFHQDDLTDISEEHQTWAYKKLSKDLDTLRTYNAISLSKSENYSKDILDYTLSIYMGGEKYRYHNYPVNQVFGIQNEFPNFMATIHPIESKDDAADYIARLSKTDLKFSQLLDGLRIRADKGIIPPKFIIEQVLVEMQNFVSTKNDNNILYKSFIDRLDNIQNLQPQIRDNLLSRTRNEIDNTVYPAYKKLIVYFEELLPIADDRAGVWKLPDGDNFYNYCLQSHTTTSLTAEEIHNIGLDQVGRIQQKIQEKLGKLGYNTQTSFYQTMKEFADNNKYYYENSDLGRSQALQDYKNYIEDSTLKSKSLFSGVVNNSISVERVPQYKENTSPVAYCQRQPKSEAITAL